MDSEEYEYQGMVISGFTMLLINFIVLPALVVWGAFGLYDGEEPLAVAIIVVGVIAFIFLSKGYFTQEPNEARVAIFFGKYKGTIRKVGFFWINPLMSCRKLSLRIRNLDIDPIKVNDKVGNPVLIGMVLVWKISDTYKVVFDLDSSVSASSFVSIQSDAALREVTGHYAYDQTDSGTSDLTLRDGGAEINDQLERKINDRLSMAGIEVVEARINYLAYAPEIAAVMLRRQQAAAIISAREKIVEGAVSMVDMALRRIEADGVVKLDEEKKAMMVSNLLVVLCADEAAQPVLNAGS